MSSICAALCIFNEEKRIESTLKTLKWCDEIFVVDRNSTDNSREIVRKYTSNIIVISNRELNPLDSQIFIDNINNEWILSVSASDVVHFNLSKKILALIKNTQFDYDIIDVPYRRFVLGIGDKFSPWYCELAPSVFRKKIMKINPLSIHGAVIHDSKKVYKMQKSNEECIYHLTHETLNIMNDRHLIYWNAEAKYSSDSVRLKTYFNDILRAVKAVFFKKTFFCGWKGIVLALSYVSYYIFKFLYVWEKRYSNAPQTYKNIRESIIKDYDKNIE